MTSPTLFWTISSSGHIRVHPGLMLLVAACLSYRGVSGDREVLSLSPSNWTHVAHTHLCKLRCSGAAQAVSSYDVLFMANPKKNLIIMLSEISFSKANGSSLDIAINLFTSPVQYCSVFYSWKHSRSLVDSGDKTSSSCGFLRPHSQNRFSLNNFSVFYLKLVDV